MADFALHLSMSAKGLPLETEGLGCLMLRTRPSSRVRYLRGLALLVSA